MNHTYECFELRLRDAPRPGDDRPVTQRLRSALKILLRAYGLRCELVGHTAEAVATGPPVQAILPP